MLQIEDLPWLQRFGFSERVLAEGEAKVACSDGRTETEESGRRERPLYQESKDRAEFSLDPPVSDLGCPALCHNERNGRSLKVIYTNASSILPKFDELRDLISHEVPDILVITESWLNSDVLDSELHIEGFSLFRCDRSSRKGGGVLMYVSTRLNPSLHLLPHVMSASEFFSTQSSVHYRLMIQFFLFSQFIEILEQILKTMTVILFVH